MKIGQLCKSYRKTKGNFSVKDIARVTGYSEYNVYAFESGKVDTFRILCGYIIFGFNMGVDVAWQELKR